MARFDYADPGTDAKYCDGLSVACPSIDCACADCRATEAARQAEVEPVLATCTRCGDSYDPARGSCGCFDNHCE